MSKEQIRQSDRRRTFGIISHPDAGKTTLTEQLLLLGGLIREAGDVRARKTKRYATSDWMAIEKERGISVTSSVMQFEHHGRIVNLLDTPGHHDFSEDTYRVLTAVDSALMVIDSVKGVETQTHKLMEVCRMRTTPILTFINKMDREGRDPLELLDDIETSLNIDAVPLSWPIGAGARFQGTYDLQHRVLHLMDRDAPIPMPDLNSPDLDRLLGSAADDLRYDAELLSEAGTDFSVDAYLAGTQTPVLFGSALDGFGVPQLLDTFVEIAPPPSPRDTTTRAVSPHETTFSGVVFKIQANMDPRHRDRMAFFRMCSGKYEPGMWVRHGRTDQTFRLANAMAFMAQGREGTDEAWPGDIIGIPNHGTLRIGDTLTAQEPLQFTGIPSFAPEHFQKARIKNALRAKHMEKGLQHLVEEGAIQMFRPLVNTDYILGAVGPLQFEVVKERLRNEYNVEAIMSSMTYAGARWVESDDEESLREFTRKQANNLARDVDGSLVYMAPSMWWLNDTVDKWKTLTFRSTKEHVFG